jgi:hypothetical protein
MRELQQSLGNARIARLLSSPAQDEGRAEPGAHAASEQIGRTRSAMAARPTHPAAQPGVTVSAGQEAATAEPAGAEAARAAPTPGQVQAPPAPPASGTGSGDDSPLSRVAQYIASALIQREPEDGGDEPTEAEKARALQEAEAAEGRAQQAQAENQAGVTQQQAGAAEEAQKKESERQKQLAAGGLGQVIAGAGGLLGGAAAALGGPVGAVAGLVGQAAGAAGRAAGGGAAAAGEGLVGGIASAAGAAAQGVGAVGQTIGGALGSLAGRAGPGAAGGVGAALGGAANLVGAGGAALGGPIGATTAVAGTALGAAGQSVGSAAGSAAEGASAGAAGASAAGPAAAAGAAAGAAGAAGPAAAEGAAAGATGAGAAGPAAAGGAAAGATGAGAAGPAAAGGAAAGAAGAGAAGPAAAAGAAAGAAGAAGPAAAAGAAGAGRTPASGADLAGLPQEPAPRSPEEDPAFVAVGEAAKGTAAQEKVHATGGAKAGEAQAAAEPPGSEVQSQGQAKQVTKIESAPAPGFNKAAFKAKLMERIQQATPSNVEEADNFKSSGKVAGVKGDVMGEVETQQEKAAEPIEKETEAPPDTAGIEPKPVTPLAEAEPGPKPAIAGVEGAAPKPKGVGELEAPVREETKAVDAQMQEAEVTDEQLAESNEPEFQSALDSKKEAKQNAVEAPKQYREEEQADLTKAQAGAQQTTDAKLGEMHASKGGFLSQILGQQTQAKSADEQKRQQVANEINRLYESTKSKVDGILGGLDAKVNAAFDKGAETARKSFESYVDERMTAYKERRYGGWFGWARWAKDKVLGMPGEVNAFYAEGRARYLAEMDAVIDQVSEIVASGLTEAKTAVAEGRKQIQDYVAKLPQDLQKVGKDAAGNIDAKFDALDQSVDSKQDELVNSLAQKYNESLKALDSRIEELKAANKGLVQKAFDAVAGVIKTILQLKDMLLSVLSSALGAVTTIIKHPVRFLGNLIDSVKEGLGNFVGNIGSHIKKGLMTWLFGAVSAIGITLPKVFDLPGIFHLVMQVLGLTWDAIRAMAVKVLGEKVVGYLEKTFDIFVTIKEKGLAGLWDFIADKIGDIKEMVMSQIEDMLTTQVIRAGIQWLIGILGGPAGAFIKAAKAIFDIVMWFLNNGKRVMSLVQSIIGSITAIASGNLGGAAKMVEESLAKAIPVVISFLASLLGLGNIAEKVKDIIQTIRKPIEKAIGWVLGKAKAAVQKVGGFIGGVKDKAVGFATGLKDKAKGAWDKRKGGPTAPDQKKEMEAEKDPGLPITIPFTVEGESHEIHSSSGLEGLVVSSGVPHNLESHPDPKVKAAYEAYKTAIQSATSQKQRRQLAKQHAQLIVNALVAFMSAQTGDAPFGSAPGIGTIDTHRSQLQRRFPTLNGKKLDLWAMESEHVLPRDWISSIFKAAGLPAVTNAEYNNMRTILIYERAAERKTSGISLRPLPDFVEEANAPDNPSGGAFGGLTGDKIRTGKPKNASPAQLWSLIQPYLADALRSRVNLTTMAVRDEAAENAAKRNEGHAGVPGQGQLQDAGNQQMDDVKEMFDSRV